MSASDQPLYRQEPTQRFSDRAAAYRQFRPSYPTAAIDAMLAGLGDPTQLRAADVGAGTGISSRLIAERGVRVIAIEPNPEMRAAALPHERVEFRDGVAERTGLDAASVDLVVAAQAFHWFEPNASLVECHRILRPSGRLAILWNERDLTDPATAEIADIMQEAAPRRIEDKRHLRPEELYTTRLFSTAWEQTFSIEQALDADGLVGRAISASYVPAVGAQADEMMKALRSAHRRLHGDDGLVRLIYRTILCLAEPLPSAAMRKAMP